MASKYDESQLSGNVLINFKYKWTISCFSLLDSRVGKCHKSDAIQLEEDGLKWYIEVYPDGDTEKCKGFVSCFVHIGETVDDVKAKYSLSLVNANEKVLFDGQCDDWVIFFDSEGYGYSETIAASDLKRKLINDALTVNLEITYFATPIKERVSIHPGAQIRPIIHVTEDLKKLFISKEHSDLVISVGEEDISVHSAVLCARSKVFRAMFGHDTVEKTTRRVEVTDFEKETMESLAEFIYSGGVGEMNFDLALELLRASDKYEVSYLKSYCSDYLKSLLDVKNVCQVLLSADMHNAEKLRKHALEYFCKNLSGENFENKRPMFKTRPDLICDIVKEMIGRYKI